MDELFDEANAEAVADDDGVREYATWADMCQPPEPEEVRLRNGKWIKFIPWVSAERMAEIQRVCRGSSRGRNWDTSKFTLMILQEVMIEPRIRTDADRRAAMKADSSVVMGIINRVVDTETFERLQEDLGES